jgi:hypothetical protein
MLVKAKQNGRARLLIAEITRSPKKKEPPGENLGITLKINKMGASRKKQHATK